MKNASFWKTFAVVFIFAFVINTAAAYAWSIFFHDSSWKLDTTTITALVAGLTLTYMLSRGRKFNNFI